MKTAVLPMRSAQALYVRGRAPHSDTAKLYVRVPANERYKIYGCCYPQKLMQAPSEEI